MDERREPRRRQGAGGRRERHEPRQRHEQRGPGDEDLTTAGVPVDVDAVGGSGGRPPHRRVGLIVAVAVGGALGTLARAGVEAALPAPGGLPLGTLAVNLVGSAALGALLEVLALRGPDVGVRRVVRLGAGTGVLGGFTTYSSFAVEVARTPADPVLIAYAVGSIVLGPVLAVLGIVAVRAAAGRRADGTSTRLPADPDGLEEGAS